MVRGGVRSGKGPGDRLGMEDDAFIYMSFPSHVPSSSMQSWTGPGLTVFARVADPREHVRKKSRRSLRDRTGTGGLQTPGRWTRGGKVCHSLTWGRWKTSTSSL